MSRCSNKWYSAGGCSYGSAGGCSNKWYDTGEGSC